MGMLDELGGVTDHVLLRNNWNESNNLSHCIGSHCGTSRLLQH
jgi:hypothetical protein